MKTKQQKLKTKTTTNQTKKYQRVTTKQKQIN